MTSFIEQLEKQLLRKAFCIENKTNEKDNHPCTVKCQHRCAGTTNIR